MPDRRLTVGASLRSLIGNRPILLLLALSAGLLIVAITAAFLAMGSLARSNQRVEHTLRVEATINRMVGLNERIETARRGYLIAPDTSFVRILQRAQTDVLLADIAMPDEDGYSLIRRIRAAGNQLASIPAAAVTAHARDDERTRALAAGFHVHMAKPVEPSEIVRMVNHLAHDRRASRRSRV